MTTFKSRCLCAALAAFGLVGSAWAADSEPFRYKVPLFGVAAVGEADVNPAALGFPDRQVGLSAPAQIVTVSNHGTRNLNFSGVSIADGASHFAQSNNCSTLVPGQSCEIQVQFTPADVGDHTGTLAIRHDGSTPEFYVSLAGTGRSQSATLTAPSFASTQVGSTSKAAAILSNTGIGPLSVQTPLVTGPAFAFSGSNCGTSLAVGTDCDIEVSFTPTSRTPASGMLSVNTGGGAKSVALGSTGLQGVVSLTPGDLTFALQQIATTSAAKYVTLTNTGSAPMAVAGVGMVSGGSDFNQSNTCGSSLGVGDNCIISVAFTPTAAGTRSGSVGFATDAEGASQFNVTGSGTPAAVVNSASFTQALVTTGYPATFNWATSNSVSATVSCSGTTTGSATGLSGTLVATTSGVGTGTCVVTATNEVGIKVQSSAQVSVIPEAFVTSAGFSPSQVRVGDTSTFSWATRDAVSATVDCTAPAQGSGTGLSGSIPVTATGVGTGSCRVTVVNAAGWAGSYAPTLSVLPAYTYAWDSTGWTIPSACGATMASRTVTCKRDDGATVADSFCNAGTHPGATTPTSDYSACTYAFTYGTWVTPNACGPTTSTRTAACKRSDGTTVADTYCGTPVTTQAATNYNTCTYAFSYSGWTTPSACGATTSTRTATCIRSDGTTVADASCGTPTLTQGATDYRSCTYAWAMSGWSASTAACGASSQSRSVTCVRSDGTTVADASCSGAKPAGTQSSTDYSTCSYAWTASAWSAPAAACGASSQSRSVTCLRSDGTTVSDSGCGAAKPATSQGATDYSSCSYSWSYGGWYVPPACGTVTASRASTCIRSDGTTVDTGTCDRTIGGAAWSTTTTDYSACTYSWGYGQWNIPNGCGAVTATRSAGCFRSDGALVDNGTCDRTIGGAAWQTPSTNYNSCSYSWSYGGWDIPNGCGTVTATRSATCIRSDGAQVGNDVCDRVIGGAAWSTPTTNYNSCSYSWQYGGWNIPNGCGTVTATRSAGCFRSDGTQVGNDVCDRVIGGAAWSTPTTNYNSCSYSWSYGGWNIPNGCGTVTATRSATCVRSDGTAVDTGTCDRTIGGAAWSTPTTNYNSCTYSWGYGEWNIPNGCGTVTATRSAGCFRSDGAVMDSGTCDRTIGGAAWQTPTTNYNACGYNWSYGGWSGCSASCGGGTQTRSATCIRTDGSAVANAYCGSPATTQSCNTQACAPTWTYSVSQDYCDPYDGNCQWTCATFNAQTGEPGGNWQAFYSERDPYAYQKMDTACRQSSGL